MSEEIHISAEIKIFKVYTSMDSLKNKLAKRKYLIGWVAVMARINVFVVEQGIPYFLPWIKRMLH
jgi:hypothetical protein